MVYVDVLIQTIALLLCLTAPGYFLLSRFIGNTAWASFPPAMRFAWSWTVSSILIALVSSLSFLLPKIYVQGIAWATLVFSLTIGIIGLRRIFAGNFDKLEIYGIGVFFLILAVGLSFYPLSPYPSLLSVGYGDSPSYYRVATNILNKHHPVLDFRIGDFPGENYLPPVLFPLLVLVTSFFLNFFQDSSYVLGLFCTLSGALSVYFGLSLLRFPGTNQARTLILWTVLIVFSLNLNQNIIHLGLGALTLPTALYILVLSHIMLFPENITRARQITMGVLTGLAIIISRPEGFLFFVVLIVSSALFLVIASMRLVWKKGMIFFTAYFLMLILIIGLGVSIGKKVPPYHSLTLSYVKYSEKDKTFKFAYEAVSFVNHALIKQSLGEKWDDEYNPHIVEEIIAHPFQFLVYATKDISESLENEGLMSLFTVCDNETDKLKTGAIVRFPTLSLCAIEISALENETIMILFAFCALACISRPKPKTCILFTAFILFFYAMFCTNFAFTKRQSAAIFLPLPFVFSWIVSRYFLASVNPAFSGLTEVRSSPIDNSRRTARILSSTPFCFAVLFFILISLGRPLFLDVFIIYKARTTPENTAYIPAIETLKKMIKPGMTVASTYPELLGYTLNTASVGNSLLLPGIEKLIAKYSPDLILIDDFRTPNYTDFLEKKISLPGYKVAIVNPIAKFLVLEKTN